MAQETIKEFIAKIGFSVDKSSERRFMQGIEGAVVKANLLATALEEMARVAVQKVGEVADTFEKLGYEASRAGTSAQHIRAFEFAVSQLGGTAAAAGASVQNFGRLMRLTDNQYGFIEGTLGIATKVNGVARDNIDVMNDIAVKLAEMSNTPLGRSLAEQFRQRFQIDEPTLLAMEKTAQFQKLYQDQLARDVAAGIGGPEAVKAATDFEQAWRNVTANIDANISGLAKDAETFLTPILEKLDEIQRKSGPAIDFKSTKGRGRTFGSLFGFDITGNWTDDFEKNLHIALIDIEKWGRDVESFFETLPWSRWLFGVGGAQTSGVGLGGIDTLGMPSDATGSGGGIGGWLGRAWGGVKSFFGGNGVRRRRKELDPALDEKIKAKALQWGIDPDVARRVYASEGGGSNLGYMQPGDNGTSFGPFQLHRGGPGSVGTEYERQTGFSADDPKHIDDYLDFTMNWVRNHGWGAWSGARKQGIEGYQGVGPLPVARAPAPDYSPPAPLKPAAPSPSEHPTWFAPKGQQPWEMPSRAWSALDKALPTEDPHAAALSAAASIDTSKTISSAVTNNVNVYGSGDPHSAAAMVGLHLDRNNNDLVRNMQGATQ